jgi:hypothetical protein
MLATRTHRRLRTVSRRLQQRHPWLRLELAAGLAEGMESSPLASTKQEEVFTHLVTS